MASRVVDCQLNDNSAAADCFSSASGLMVHAYTSVASFVKPEIASLHWSETPERGHLHDSQFVSSMIPDGWSGDSVVIQMGTGRISTENSA